MGVKVTNNAFGTISAGINNSVTTIVLDSGQGARFPTLGSGDFFFATLIDTSNNLEIVKVTARSTDSMTVVRAQDNTTAAAFAIGDRFELRPTAALFDAIDLTGGGTISGAVDIETTAQEALHITGTNSDHVRMKLENTTSGVDLSYYEAKSDNGSGYLIHNGTGQGNSLASGETYIWSGNGKVSLIPAGTIGKKLEVNTNGDVTVNGKVFGSGLVLLQETTFTSNTSSVAFDVFDDSKYGHYLFYWICNHGPAWTVTALRFRNSSGDITSSSYNNNVSWKSSTAADTAPTHNNSTYAGNQSYAWMAGNGSAYASHGQGQISFFADGVDRTLVTGMSQLINQTGTDHYDEKWTSAFTGSAPHTNLTGFSIFGTGGNSSFGRFTVFGVERA
tara:strand:- start:845 stop:2014 length:1170 start_codon:yes stop_codon:yes gene_type:complete